MNINRYNSIVKYLLHTRYGSFIGFKLGIRGYNRVEPVINLATGQIKRLRPSYNSRVNVGAALSASLLSGSTLGGISSPLPPKYIALSTSVLSPASTDTTLSGETSASGLGRTAGTIGGYVAPTILDGGSTYTITHTFTDATGGHTLNSSGLFDASSSGNLFAEANFSAPATLVNPSDTIVITWTINL